MRGGRAWGPVATTRKHLIPEDIPPNQGVHDLLSRFPVAERTHCGSTPGPANGAAAPGINRLWDPVKVVVRSFPRLGNVSKGEGVVRFRKSTPFHITLSYRGRISSVLWDIKLY
jgi:hypothetical protein